MNYELYRKHLPNMLIVLLRIGNMAISMDTPPKSITYYVAEYIICEFSDSTFYKVHMYACMLAILIIKKTISSII